MKKSLKAQAQAVAGQYGIPLSTLFNAYAHQLVRTGQIYFPAVEVAMPQTEKIIVEAERDIRAGRVSRSFTNAEDFIADLEKVVA